MGGGRPTPTQTSRERTESAVSSGPSTRRTGNGNKRRGKNTPKASAEGGPARAQEHALGRQSLRRRRKVGGAARQLKTQNYGWKPKRRLWVVTGASGSRFGSAERPVTEAGSARAHVARQLRDEGPTDGGSTSPVLLGRSAGQARALALRRAQRSFQDVYRRESPGRPGAGSGEHATRNLGCKSKPHAGRSAYLQKQQEPEGGAVSPP